MTTLEQAAAPLLALIRKTETGVTGAKQYTTIIGHKEDELDRPITEMTVNQVIAAQRTWPARFNVKSGAAGAYQIIRKTLTGLRDNGPITGTAKYSPANQDKLGLALLKGRGLQKFLNGQLSIDSFALALAKEWASFPVPATGKSYYDGDDAGNHALVKIGVVRKVLGECLALWNEEKEIPTMVVGEDEEEFLPDPASTEPEPKQPGLFKRLLGKLFSGPLAQAAVRYTITPLLAMLGGWLVSKGLIDDMTWATINRLVERALGDGFMALLGGASLGAVAMAILKGLQEASKDKVAVDGTRVTAKTASQKRVLRDAISKLRDQE